jgi:hypothetical protein
MQYFVDIKLRSRRLLTKRMLLAVAEIGGVATGKIGGKRLETTLTVTADDAEYAETCVLNFIRRRLPSEFEVVEARAVAAAEVGVQRQLPGTLPPSSIRPAG